MLKTTIQIPVLTMLRSKDEFRPKSFANLVEDIRNRLEALNEECLECREDDIEVCIVELQLDLEKFESPKRLNSCCGCLIEAALRGVPNIPLIYVESLNYDNARMYVLSDAIIEVDDDGTTVFPLASPSDVASAIELWGFRVDKEVLEKLLNDGAQQ